MERFRSGASYDAFPPAAGKSRQWVNLETLDEFSATGWRPVLDCGSSVVLNGSVLVERAAELTQSAQKEV